jgi:hypothetical protein
VIFMGHSPFIYPYYNKRLLSVKNNHQQGKTGANPQISPLRRRIYPY